MESVSMSARTAHQSWCAATEVDWGKIDVVAARRDLELLMMVRRATLCAARRTVGLSRLLAALAADSLASALLARELHDSWKHFHVMRSYLDVTDYSPGITDLELEQHLRTAPECPLNRNEDISVRLAHLLDDAIRDCETFALIGARAADPSLARLACRIAGDRKQHSLAVAHFPLAAGRASQPKTA